jgi:transcriptional regulator with XRE-family HTH domain
MAATIGERLRRLRSERGLTQEQLAGLASVSVDLVKKLEQGRRESARLASLAALADALDVPLSELTDKRPRLDGAGDRLVLSLRDVLLTPDLLPGMDPADDDEPAPMDELRSLTSSGWRDYWGGRFAELARRAPGLIGEARHAHRAGMPGRLPAGTTGAGRPGPDRRGAGHHRSRRRSRRVAVGDRARHLLVGPDEPGTQR